MAGWSIGCDGRQGLGSRPIGSTIQLESPMEKEEMGELLQCSFRVSRWKGCR